MARVVTTEALSPLAEARLLGHVLTNLGTELREFRRGKTPRPPERVPDHTWTGEEPTDPAELAAETAKQIRSNRFAAEELRADIAKMTKARLHYRESVAWLR